MAEKKSNTLVKNASIMMVATILSRIIGLIYRSPLGTIVGSVGMGYYGYASNLYAILLLISSYSIPSALSKIVSERLAKKEYRNAQKVFRGALLYAVIVGLGAALVAWFLGSWLLPRNQQNALPALRVLAPTIFVSAILGVLRGYFQAYRSMAPTSISQILEQIMNAVVSVLAAWLMVRGVTDKTQHAIRGSMGGTLGTGAGVAVGLLFMLFVYVINRNFFRRQLKRDRTGKEESYRDVFRVIILMVTPIILTTFIQNASNYLDSYIYSTIQGVHGYASDTISAAYGEFSNYFQPVIGIPTALASATVSAMMPEVSGSYAVRDYDSVNRSISTTLRLTMFIVIPAMVGMTVLAKPVMGVLFPSSTEIAVKLMLVGSSYVLFSSLTMITSGVLQAIGQQQRAMINAAVSLIFNLVLLASLLAVMPGLDINAVAIVNVLSSLLLSFINTRTMRRYLGYRSEFMSSYGYPLLASAGMGLLVFAIYELLFHLTRRPSIALIVSVVAGILVYLILYVVVTHTSEEEMKRYPMGTKIVRILRALRIYR